MATRIVFFKLTMASFGRMKGETRVEGKKININMKRNNFLKVLLCTSVSLPTHTTLLFIVKYMPTCNIMSFSKQCRVDVMTTSSFII